MVSTMNACASMEMQIYGRQSPNYSIIYYMKKERKIKNENGAKKQQKTTFLMQITYCDRRM